MAFLWLVLRFAFRNRLRTALTALGVATTLLAFLVLRTLVANWYSVNEEAAASDRMIIRHKIAITYPLFTPQAEKIRALPGVLDVSWLCWFGATYKNERDTFAQLATDTESYLRLYPEYRPPPDQLSEWLADPTGAMVGIDLVKRYGWKIGDRIVLNGTYYAGDWDFTLRAIYPGASEDTERALFFLHWKYLNDKLPGGNHVQRLLVKVDNPAVGKRIDALFANSETPTATESELAVRQQWASMSSAIVSAIDVASIVVLIILVLVLGNGMAMATRDSTREYAAMRAIGYRPRHVTALVLGEGFTVAALGIAAGLLVAPAVLESLCTLLENRLGGFWELELKGGVTVVAAIAALAAGMLASAMPAWRAGRLRIVDALRRVA
jgi:putative ABC transport system permease protein